jgi:hypothetical protein
VNHHDEQRFERLRNRIDVIELDRASQRLRLGNQMREIQRLNEIIRGHRNPPVGVVEQPPPFAPVNWTRQYKAQGQYMLTNFQRAVGRWMRECFRSETAMTIEQRGFRMLEEANELAQSCGVTQAEAHRLVDYVYSRPAGLIEQEVGGVMVTVAGLCEAANLTLEVAAERELGRCIKNTEKIREKDLAKPARSALPGASP